jgi:hypothetical protein
MNKKQVKKYGMRGESDRVANEAILDRESRSSNPVGTMDGYPHPIGYINPNKLKKSG